MRVFFCAGNCVRESRCYKLWIRRDMGFLECSSILYKIVKKEKQFVAYFREMEIVQMLWSHYITTLKLSSLSQQYF